MVAAHRRRPCLFLVDARYGGFPPKTPALMSRLPEEEAPGNVPLLLPWLKGNTAVSTWLPKLILALSSVTVQISACLLLSSIFLESCNFGSVGVRLSRCRPLLLTSKAKKYLLC